MLAVGLASTCLAGCGGSTSTPAATSTGRATTKITTPAARRRHAARPKPARPGRSPGALPQTHQLPTATSSAFRREMAALWDGVRSGSVARPAALVAVDMPRGFAHWVAPGACFNRIGYYELPNSRIVYREHGQVRSFGIAC